jgi:histone deacetylase 6
LQKLEASLKAKEQLAEGLHLVDFEQLKIENGTLAEKTEERATELHKLRLKKTAAVEVLSHVKEKLHFTQQQASSASKTLAQVKKGVAGGGLRLGDTR